MSDVELPEQPRPARDKGSALMLATVFVLIGALMVVPLLRYASNVIRNSSTQRLKTYEAEAARGALRTALADPIALYNACSNAGLTIPVDLASPGLATPISMKCTMVKSATELNDEDLRLALATTQAGSVLPVGAVGTPYPRSGDTNTSAWLADYTTTSTGGMIYLPYLPTHALTHPATGGYMMPAWAGTCRVFFPGTYSDPVTINDSIPTYFTSGIYYFEDTVTFSGAADVVIGAGAVPGCAEDQDAAFNAVNAPVTHNSSGLGATFVFGDAGRLVITDGGGAAAPSVQFNSRLVDPTDVGSAVSAGVSIVSVNGVTVSATTSTDLNLPTQLVVPKSLTESNPGDSQPPLDAAATSYKPSTLVPVVQPLPPTPPVTPTPPIIDISFTGAGTGTVYVPGYVAVPQGSVSIQVGVGMGAGKTVQLIGGVIAAEFLQSADLPEVNQLGVINRIVQKTFKIVARTTNGKPDVTSVAIVQVNDYGEFAVNSWVTTAP